MTGLQELLYPQVRWTTYTHSHEWMGGPDYRWAAHTPGFGRWTWGPVAWQWSIRWWPPSQLHYHKVTPCRTGHLEPSNAEPIGVLGEVDWPLKNEPLGAVVSADVPSVSPVVSAIHTARQVRLRLGGSKGSSRLSQDPQDPQGQALAVASQQAVPLEQRRLRALPPQQQPLFAGIVWQHGALPRGFLVWLFWQLHLPALRRLFWGLST